MGQRSRRSSERGGTRLGGGTPPSSSAVTLNPSRPSGHRDRCRLVLPRLQASTVLPVEIREARPEEYDAVAELTIAAYRALPGTHLSGGYERADCGI